MARKTKLETLREMERALDASLKHLRQVIRAAERGENKRIKNTARYLATKSRQIARLEKEQDKLQQQELDKLEKFLGETFETITEARNAFSKETKKATKKDLSSEARRLRAKKHTAKSDNQRARLEHEARRLEVEAGTRTPELRLKRSKTRYTVRQLSDKQKQSVIDFITDGKSFRDVGKGWIQPGEALSISVTYRRKGETGRLHTERAIGKKLVYNMADLQKYIETYLDEDSENLEEWLGDIEVIRFSGEKQYRQTKRIVDDKRKRENKRMSAFYKKKEKEASKKRESGFKSKLAKKDRTISKLKAEIAAERGGYEFH